MMESSTGSTDCLDRANSGLEKGTQSKRMKGSVKYIILVLIMCITVAVFSIPIIFYYITPYLSTKKVINNVVANDSTSASCGSILWGSVVEESTECVQYSESICLPHLTQWNQCLLQNQNELMIAIDGGVDQLMILEQEIASMQSLLETFPACKSEMIPFLCHYYFPLISKDECGSIDKLSYTVTQEECNDIRDTVCANPWQLAINFGFGQSLPACSSLPFSDTNNGTHANMANDTALSSDNNTTADIMFTCKDDFISISNTCFPRCDKFSGYSATSTSALLFIEVFCSAVTVVFSIIAFIVAMYHRKKMFTFPSFFFLLVLMDLFVGDALLVILSMDRYKLSCSSVNLLEAIENPTLFCIIGGALYYYVFSNLTLWWFLHVCYFTYEVNFPFHARRMRAVGRTKYIAAILLVLGFVIPLPGAVLIPLLSKERNYRVTRFPPTICTPDEQTWFYTFFFMSTVLACISTYLLVSVMWIIRTRLTSKSKTYSSNSTFKVSTAEKKILIVFIYISAFTVFVITVNSVLIGKSEEIKEELTNYFLCEITGYEPGKCNRRGFEKLLYPELSILVYIIVALIPIILLNFITNIERYIKSIIAKCTHRYSKTTTDSPSTDGTSTFSLAPTQSSIYAH